MGKNKKKSVSKPKLPSDSHEKERDVRELEDQLSNGSAVETWKEPNGREQNLSQPDEQPQPDEQDSSDDNSELKELVEKQQRQINELMNKLSLADKSTYHDNRPSNNDDESSTIEALRDQLVKSEAAKEEAEENYQSLLGKISHIKATLGERLKSDAAEIQEYQAQVEELDSTIARNKSSIEELQREVIAANRDNDKLSHDLSSLRAEIESNQEDWAKERDTLMNEHKKALHQAEKHQLLLQNMELAVAEDRTMREDVKLRISDLEEQVSSQTHYAERYRQERDEFQQQLNAANQKLNAEKLEASKVQKSLEGDCNSLKEKLTVSQQQHLQATERITQLEAQLQKFKPMEAEVKEKNLLIGKLRHEAVILNEHITKALRMIKKESEGETCDKQLISNLIISFVQIPRGDTKKFEVLQLISDYLGWDDEKKIQAGLSRSGPGGFGSPSKRGSADDTAGGSVGFMGLFAEFLEREASRKNENAR